MSSYLFSNGLETSSALIRLFVSIAAIGITTLLALRMKCAEDALRRSEAYLAEGERLSLTGNFGWEMASHGRRDRFFGSARRSAARGTLQSEGTCRRMIVEKRVGHDFASAQALNASAVEDQICPEDPIYPIDYLLGNETVQNISALRLGKGSHCLQISSVAILLAEAGSASRACAVIEFAATKVSRIR